MLFPWEGLSLLKKDGCCALRVYLSIEIPAAAAPCVSLVPLTSYSPHATTAYTTLPLSKPKMSSCEHKTFVLAPLIKKRGGLFLWWDPSFSQQTKNPSLSLLDAGWEADPETVALCLGAQSRFVASLFLGGSSHSHATTSASHPWKRGCLLSCPHPPYESLVGFWLSLVKSLFSR